MTGTEHKEIDPSLFDTINESSDDLGLSFLSKTGEKDEFDDVMKPNPLSDTLEDLVFVMLSSLSLFKDVCPQAIQHLVEVCPVVDLKKDEILLEREKINEAAYLLIVGRLRVHLDRLGEDPMILLDAGECVGEMSIIEGTETTAYVLADRPCRLLEIPRSNMWDLIESSHAFSKNLLFIMSRRVRESNASLVAGKREQKRAAREARSDALTGLFNRGWLDKYYGKLLNRCVEMGKPFSLIMLDVDHFKNYNDSYGHPAGDSALMALGSAIQSSLRPDDLAVRYGGEEFTVLLTGTELETALGIAERVRVAVEKAIVYSSDLSELPSIRISLGVAEYEDGNSHEELLSKADSALYRAKSAGRNQVST